ncbi:Gliding motility lipoprotein GldH [termite gut metagenome]|uniref:Gliding motility lipoprotein GldH n=1 Tax=termite gut metagenome TaxID=433724 RepID=A0A5J4RZV6_9ZZZZ
MKNPPKHSILVAVITALILAGCTDNIVYHSYRYIPGKRWNRRDTLTFDVPIADSFPTYYYLYVHVRNLPHYPYQNLLLLVSHNLQDSSVMVTDTVRGILASETGRWAGKGLGTLFQITLPVNEYTVDYPAGVRTVRVTHGMEDETLIGINDVGIRIEK